MKPVRQTIERLYLQALESAGVEEPAAPTEDLVLLQSGLDSLGFAILISRLESEFGCDPFTMMKEAVYPRTYAEFVKIYETYVPQSGAE